MRKRKALLLVLSVAFALATGFSNFNSQPAYAVGEDWTLPSVPEPSDIDSFSYMTDVECPSDTSCQAVGLYLGASGGGIIYPLIKTFNGTGWTVSASSTSSLPSDYLGGNGLSEVACATVTTCVAVGSYQSTSIGNPGFPMIMRTADGGATWTVVVDSSSNYPPDYSTSVGLKSVTCSSINFCAAVGYYTSNDIGNPTRALIMQSTNGGATWAAASSTEPSDLGNEVFLNSVSCAEDNSCAAVGYYDSSGVGDPYKPLVITFDGSAWNNVTLADPLDFYDHGNFNSVFCAANTSCHAVGSYQDNGGVQHPLIVTYDGASWTFSTGIDPIDFDNNAVLSKVTCAHTGMCQAVGSFEDPSGARRAFVESFNGSWSSTTYLPIASDFYNNAILNDVSCPTDSSCQAVGSYESEISGNPTQPYILHFNGIDWSRSAITSPSDLGSDGDFNGVSCTTAYFCQAVGFYESNAGGNPNLSLIETYISEPAPDATDPYMASDVLGQPGFTSESINAGQGPTVNSQGFNGPNGVVIDTVHHRLFVVEQSNNRVLVFNLDSNNDLIDKTADFVLGQANFTTNSAGTSQTEMRQPRGLDYDAVHDRLFVGEANNERLLVFDTASITNGEPAVNVLGQPDFDTEGCSAPTASTLCGVYGDPRYDSVRGWLYVTDLRANRVVVYDVNSITDGEPAIHVLGQPGFDTDTSLCAHEATATGMCAPINVTVDTIHGRLFVNDNENHRVLVYDVNTLEDGEAAVNVLGQPDFNHGDSDTNARGFIYPDGLVYDAQSNLLYVSEYSNNRILLFDVSSIENNEVAMGVLGQVNFTTYFDGVSQTKMHQPTGMTLDPTNHRLYVTERWNNRVLIYDFVHVSATAGALPDAPIGASYSYDLGVENGQGTVEVSIIAGALPPGLSLDPLTGIITGTPTAYGTYSFEVAASDTVLGIGTFLHDPLYTITIPSPVLPGAPNTGLGHHSQIGDLGFVALGIGLIIVAVRRKRMMLQLLNE